MNNNNINPDESELDSNHIHGSISPVENDIEDELNSLDGYREAMRDLSSEGTYPY